MSWVFLEPISANLIWPNISVCLFAAEWELKSGEAFDTEISILHEDTLH